MRVAGAKREAEYAPLRGVWVLTLAVNLPGPVAASRLATMGASVVKIEPLGGDPLARMNPDYYEGLNAGQEVVRLDLKDPKDRASLHGWLEETDLLLTASRPAALGRLGLSWPELHVCFPRLCHVAIVGHPPPDEDAPGHDLTYQASFGTFAPPELPRVLVADLAGAERAVSAALSLLLARERGQGAGMSRWPSRRQRDLLPSHCARGSLRPAASSAAVFLATGCTARGRATWRWPRLSCTSGSGCCRSLG